MIPGVVLAAGSGVRIGRPKALLPTGVAGETFLSRIAATLRASGVDDLVVVVAPGADDVRRAVMRFPVLTRVVENPHAERGQLSSLLAALAAIDHPGVSGMLVVPVDLPFVSIETVGAVLTAWRRMRAPVVRPARRGHHGHPVVFDRAAFDALRRADPTAGARAVVHEYGPAVLDVPVDDEWAFRDVDTPEDYQRATGRPLPVEPGERDGLE